MLFCFMIHSSVAMMLYGMFKQIQHVRGLMLGGQNADLSAVGSNRAKPPFDRPSCSSDPEEHPRTFQTPANAAILERPLPPKFFGAGKQTTFHIKFHRPCFFGEHQIPLNLNPKLPSSHFKLSSARICSKRCSAAKTPLQTSTNSSKMPLDQSLGNFVCFLFQSAALVGLKWI